MKLTKTVIRGLALPPGKSEAFFWDSEVPRFGARLRIDRGPCYVVQYKVGGTTTRRLSIAPLAQMSVEKARETAKTILAKVRLGQDPAGDKRTAREKASQTFGARLPDYLTYKRTGEDALKPRSYEEVKRHLLVHAKPLHTLPVTSVDRRIIAKRLDKILEKSGPRAANNTRVSLSGYCTWLVGEGVMDANPVAGTNKKAENGPRKHLIGYPGAPFSPPLPPVVYGELARLWHALGEDQYSSILKLLLLTGTRRDEIAGLRWTEVDLDGALITLPEERTKNKRVHLVPLVPAALAILKAQPQRTNADGTPREFVFGNGSRGWQDWSGSKADLDTRIKPPLRSWVPHDFRRLLSTVMHESVKDGGLGIMPHVVETILGHVGGHKAGVAGVYNKALYLGERRLALESWAAFVQSLVASKQKAAA